MYRIEIVSLSVSGGKDDQLFLRMSRIWQVVGLIDSVTMSMGARKLTEAVSRTRAWKNWSALACYPYIQDDRRFQISSNSGGVVELMYGR